MLSESSYRLALYIYLGCASGALIVFGWWLSRHWTSSWVALAVLLGAALLLTPAYPDASVTTLAPALVVAAFEGLLYGPEAARHAVKPLLFMSALAVIATIILRFTLFRTSKAKE